MREHFSEGAEGRREQRGTDDRDSDASRSKRWAGRLANYRRRGGGRKGPDDEHQGDGRRP